MTNDEAIKILAACKLLAERANGAFPGGLPSNYPLTQQDLGTLQDFRRVESDPLTAGPVLLKRLFTQADLSLVEVYKLDQLQRMVSKRRYQGRDVANGSIKKI